MNNQPKSEVSLVDLIMADRAQTKREAFKTLTEAQIEKMREQEPTEGQERLAKQLGLLDEELATMNRFEVSEYIEHALASPINKVVVERLLKWGCNIDLVSQLTGAQSLEVWKKITANRRSK